MLGEHSTELVIASVRLDAKIFAVIWLQQHQVRMAQGILQAREGSDAVFVFHAGLDEGMIFLFGECNERRRYEGVVGDKASVPATESEEGSNLLDIPRSSKGSNGSGLLWRWPYFVAADNVSEKGDLSSRPQALPEL